MPPESVIFRRDWSGYSDAFSRALDLVSPDFGERWLELRARIDHIGPALACAPAGDYVGSDHCRWPRVELAEPKP